MADALSHAGAVSSGGVLLHGLGQPLYLRRGPSSQSVPGPADTLGDTDFVAWVLREHQNVGICICTHVLVPPLLLPSSC